MADGNQQVQQLTEQQEWVRAICEVTGWNWRIPANAGRAGKLAKGLRAAGGTWQDFEKHYGQMDAGGAWWWYRDDWRGKLGQRPNHAGINETWGAWELPVAVQVRPASAVERMLAYAEELAHEQH